MKDVFIELVLGIFLGICFVIFCLVIASVSRSVYSMGVHPHGELALVGYNYEGAYSPNRAFFMRYLSMRSHVMAELEGDTFECAGFLCSLSTNPFQLCHPHLVVNGEAPIYKGAHFHA